MRGRELGTCLEKYILQYAYNKINLQPPYNKIYFAQFFLTYTKQILYGDITSTRGMKGNLALLAVV